MTTAKLITVINGVIRRIPPTETNLRIARIQEELQSKRRLLKLYQDLIARNTSIPRPNDAIQLPCIILELESEKDAFVRHQADGKAACLTTSSKMTAHAPRAVLERLFPSHDR
jgi:hypothetical protein